MRWADGKGRGVGGEQGQGRTREENLWESVKWERPVAPKSEHLGALYEAWGGWECFSKVLRHSCGANEFVFNTLCSALWAVTPGPAAPLPSDPLTSQKHCSKKSTTFIPHALPGLALFCLLVQSAPSKTPTLMWQTNHRAGTFFPGIIHIW